MARGVNATGNQTVAFSYDYFSTSSAPGASREFWAASCFALLRSRRPPLVAADRCIVSWLTLPAGPPSGNQRSFSKGDGNVKTLWQSSMTRRAPVVFASIFFALFVGACRAAEPTIPVIDQRMLQFVAEQQFSGAVTLVAKEGKIVHLSAVGLADIEKKTPLTIDDQFSIASMTKPFTATAFMMLVEEGKASLDDPVEKYLPAFAESKTDQGEPVRGLTIRRLLTHTSGLTGPQGCEVSLAQSVDELAKRPFTFQPDAKWEYGPSVTVVGRLIEVLSGKTYEEFLAERIFTPLGMKNSTFHPTAEQLSRIPTLYEPSEDGKSLQAAVRQFATGQPGEVANPSAGLFSTAGDLFRFYQMVLNEGEWEGRRLLSAETVRTMTSLQSGDHETGFTPGNGWGLGWCLVQKPQGVTESLSPGTCGHGGAFGTEGWIDRQNKTIYILLIQRGKLPNSDASDFRKELHRLGKAG